MLDRWVTEIVVEGVGGYEEMDLESLVERQKDSHKEKRVNVIQSGSGLKRHQKWVRVLVDETVWKEI